MDCVHPACLKDKAQPDGCCRYVGSTWNRKAFLFPAAAKVCQAWQLALFMNTGALTWGSRPGAVPKEERGAWKEDPSQSSNGRRGEEEEDSSHQVNKTKAKVSVFLLARDAHLLRGGKDAGPEVTVVHQHRQQHLRPEEGQGLKGPNSLCGTNNSPWVKEEACKSGRGDRGVQASPTLSASVWNLVGVERLPLL